MESEKAARPSQIATMSVDFLSGQESGSIDPTVDKTVMELKFLEASLLRDDFTYFLELLLKVEQARAELKSLHRLAIANAISGKKTRWEPETPNKSEGLPPANVSVRKLGNS